VRQVWPRRKDRVAFTPNEKSRCEHGLKYGLDRQSAPFCNDINATLRMLFRRGVAVGRRPGKWDACEGAIVHIDIERPSAIECWARLHQVADDSAGKEGASPSFRRSMTPRFSGWTPSIRATK
jgi:hypothetical protein